MNPNDARDQLGQYDDGQTDRAKKRKGRHFVPPLANALEQCITLDMVQNVVNTIYVMALQGHMPAARLFLHYAVGKPAKMQDGSDTAAHEPEAVEQTVATPVTPVAPMATAEVEQTVPPEAKPAGAGEQTVAKSETTVMAGEQTVRTGPKTGVGGGDPIRANGCSDGGAAFRGSQVSSPGRRGV